MIQQRKSEVQKRREDIFVHPSVMPQTTPADIQRLRNKATPTYQFLYPACAGLFCWHGFDVYL